MYQLMMRKMTTKTSLTTMRPMQDTPGPQLLPVEACAWRKKSHENGSPEGRFLVLIHHEFPP
jgi:hypothetical protein